MILILRNIMINMIPVRCFTCNKVLGNKGETVRKALENGVDMNVFWPTIGITRPCCKMLLQFSLDLTEKRMVYHQYKGNKYIEFRKTSEEGFTRVYEAI